MEEEDDIKRKDEKMETENDTDDEMCVNEDCNSSGETAIVSDSENKEKEAGSGSPSPSDSYENISTQNEKDITYRKKTTKLIEKQPTNMKPKPVRSFSSQSASTTLTSSLVGMQNGKKSSVSASSQDFAQTEAVRLTGYMEKRSKMLGWKKFWCVLDGRLLTYYKSKSEYESLSACCGSINLGIASTVRPIQIRGCKGFPLQIVTRTQVYYLRSLDKATSDHWLIAIQEAASSCPKLSFPVWTDPGKQFFRYSFAALSQWSLNTSTDDISSTTTLNHMPPNYYLKNDRPQPLMQKCHSFTSLQTPVVNCVGKLSSKDDSGNNGSNSSFRRRNITNSNSIDSVSHGKVRHSTSMLALESSPQAGELKRELSRKLSVGSTMAEKTDILIESFSKEKEKKKTDVEKDEDEDNGSHHYDEILDFEGGNYEPCGKEENNLNNGGDNDIYEHVEAVDDPWEKLDAKKIDLKVEKRNCGASQVRGCPNRNSLVSISELPEDVHNSKGKNLETIPENKSQWKNVSFKGNNSDEDSSNCSSIQNLSTIPEKSGKRWKALGGFFQKIFHKEKSKKSKDNKESKSGPMVITGPVDLRSRVNSQEKEKPKKGQAPAIPTNVPAKSVTKNPHPVGSQLAINNENVMDELKKKVGNMKRIDSEESNSDLSSKSGSFSTPTLEPKCVASVEEIKNHPILQKKISNDSVSSIDTNASACIRELSLALTTKTSETELKSAVSEKEVELVEESAIEARENKSDEFQLKLARFNRLSQKLSTSFAAVLNPVPVNPTFGHIGRSRSCRFQNKSDETLPPLPPKKKNSPKVVPIYDVPPNNRPVSKEHLELIQSEQNNPPRNPPHKVLAKKNSAPEIIFSSSSSSLRKSGDSINFLRSSLQDSKYGEENNVVDTSTPPPRPPKLHNVSSTESARSCEEQGVQDQSAVDITAPEENSPKMENLESCIEKSSISTCDAILETSTSNDTDIKSTSVNETNEVDSIHKEEVPADDNAVTSSAENSSIPVEKTNETSSAENSSISLEKTNETSSEESSSILLEKTNETSLEENSLIPLEKTDENSVEMTKSNSNITHESSTDLVDANSESADTKISPTQIRDNIEESENCKEEDAILEVNIEKEISQTAQLLTVDSKLSPTASNKSVDIDSLEILSDYSDLNAESSSPPPDSPPPIPYEHVQLDFTSLSKNLENGVKKIDKEDTDEDVGVSIEEIPGEEVNDKDHGENEHIYENIKFATIQTIVQELETVEENEEEMSELYDDFPFEFSTPSPQFKYGESPVESSQTSLFVNDKPRVDSIRHSGIDQLEAFLKNSDVSNLSNESMTDDFDFNEDSNMLSVFPPPPPIFRTGAVSRLGHSSAINQLQRITENN